MLLIELLNPRTLSQKIYLIGYLLFVLFILFNTILPWKGRDFPNKAEILYSEGTINYNYQQDGRSKRLLLILDNVNNTKEHQVFGCSYSAYSTPSTSVCISKKYIEDYIGKKAIFGWYYQTDFFGFHNPIPQLVSINVDGKYIKSYEDTKKNFLKMNIGRSFISLINLIISFLIFYKFIYLLDSIKK